MKVVFLKGCCLLLVVASHTVGYSQRINQYHLEAGMMASTGQTPFWLRANQYGTIPIKGPIAQFRAGLYADYRPADSSGHRRKADWGYGADVVVNAGQTNQFLLPEAYLKGRFGAFELYGGRRREIIGLVDTLLTTGAYIWSGNALPIPKIQLSLPNYTPVPFTKGVISIMGAFAHGWFENADRLVKGSYLHQKYLYGRLGKSSWPFRLYGGFNHEVIWAGYSDYLGPSVAVNGHLPSSIRYYPAVVLGIQNFGANDPGIRTTTNFEENRIGNHLGSVDLAADADIKDWNVYVYRQFVYDDGSLYYGTNIADGLNGLRLRNRRPPDAEAIFFLCQITVEYFFSGSQGGDVFIIDDPKRRGRDNYFNHSQFLDGWTYFGRTIGTPFLTPQTEVRSSLPPYGGIANNRVSVFHVAASGLLYNKINVSTRLSYSRNAGTYQQPYVTLPAQFSGLLTASMPVNLLGETMLNGSLAFDVGGLLPNSVGVYVGLRRSGLLRKRSATKSASVLGSGDR